MASPPPVNSNNTFSVQIVSHDYYMALPIPGLDICYSSFQGGKVEKVPIIRIYDPTPAGQKACLHIHQALPYLYVPYPDEQDPEKAHIYLQILSRAVEEALRYKSTGSKRQHLHGCSLVRAKRLYIWLSFGKRAHPPSSHLAEENQSPDSIKDGFHGILCCYQAKQTFHVPADHQAVLFCKQFGLRPRHAGRRTA